MVGERSALAELIGFAGRLDVADIGAAWLGEPAPYQPLLDRGLARLNAFDADARQHERLRAIHGERLSLFDAVVGDGAVRTLHLATPESGMTSLFEPDPAGLAFFNGFEGFGRIGSTASVATTRLDDVPGLPDLDFLKMDIQGGELMALEGGRARLARCVAIQLEVSFVPLYKGQPTFGEIDVWMRAAGFLPHAFAELKRWSIAPVRRNNDMRQPFNQLLEADAVYVRDPRDLGGWQPDRIRRLVLVAHYAYRSVDLAGRLIRHLEVTGEVGTGAFDRYLALLNARKGS